MDDKLPQPNERHGCKRNEGIPPERLLTSAAPSPLARTTLHSKSPVPNSDGAQTCDWKWRTLPSSIRTLPSAPASHRISQCWLAGLATSLPYRRLGIDSDTSLTLPRRLFDSLYSQPIVCPSAHLVKKREEVSESDVFLHSPSDLLTVSVLCDIIVLRVTCGRHPAKRL